MPELTVVLPGSIRIKKNSKRIYGLGGFKKVLSSKGYIAWEEQARRAAWDYAIIPPLQCPVSVTAEFYYKGHVFDLSGAMESVADALEGILWADDTVIESWDGSRRHHDKANPRTVVTVKWEE